MDTKNCDKAYCDKNKDATQCKKITECLTKEASCTAAICGNADYKDQDTCKAFQCNAEEAKCTYAICKSPSGKDTQFCKAAYKTANPSKVQFLDPATIKECKTK